MREQERIRIIENETDFYEVDENCLENKCQSDREEKEKTEKEETDK